MPLSLAVLLPLLAQIGPTGTQIPSPLEMPRRKVVAPAPLSAPAPSPSTTRLSECLNLARTRPLDAIPVAQGWRDSTKGSARIEPGQCLGMALTALERWDQATEAFAAARDDTPAHERAGRARLGTLAANAALAGRAADKALALLDAAHGEALGAGDGHLAGEIAIDRARALVALKRDNEADAALAEARHNAPDSATGWLLSATLARRQGKLGAAQTAIERASGLEPLDPEIGLEAGVIAVLAGRDAAARKSWQSVVATAPGSRAATIAQGYLDQLGPAAAPSPQ